MAVPYAAVSLLSTVDDLFIWNKALMDNIVISKENRIRAHTAFKLDNGSEVGYGLGWRLGNVQGSTFMNRGSIRDDSNALNPVRKILGDQNMLIKQIKI